MSQLKLTVLNAGIVKSCMELLEEKAINNALTKINNNNLVLIRSWIETQIDYTKTGNNEYIIW